MSDNATDNTDNLMEGFTAEQQEQLQRLFSPKPTRFAKLRQTSQRIGGRNQRTRRKAKRI